MLKQVQHDGRNYPALFDRKLGIGPFHSLSMSSTTGDLVRGSRGSALSDCSIGGFGGLSERFVRSGRRGFGVGSAFSGRSVRRNLSPRRLSL
jgi:hypothetical protein